MGTGRRLLEEYRLVCKAFKFFASILMLAVFVLPARAIQYGDVAVTVSSPLNSERSHGYLEYRVSVANRSLSERHQIRLYLPQESHGGGTVTRTITVEPSSTVTVSLFSSIALGGNGLGVEIDGRLQRDIIGVKLSGYGYEPRPAVLVSQGASARAFQARAAAVLKDARGQEEFYAAKSDSPVEEWSTSWLGYSSYDGVVLTTDEMRVLPEPAAAALTRYVECGGTLVVIGSWQVPQPWRIEKQQDGALSTYNAGFGVCIVSENGVVDGLTPSNWQAIGHAWEQSQAPWGNPALGSLAVESANGLFPVTENVSVPVRGLLLIMLVFVILIGPVNLLVLSKKKKRMWLLWTVPLISLITCLAVSAFTVLSEGWGGRARYWSFTILDERSHRASTIGLSAFYAPLTPGDGLRYGVETEITSQAERLNYTGRSGPARNADWTEDQHLETGWVTARTPAHFMVRRTETRRERLTLTRNADGSVTVVNGLGVPIRSLTLGDEGGAVYRGSSLAAGASAILRMTNERLAPNKASGLRSVFAGDWTSLLQQGGATAELRPGTYIAELDACPFLEEGLKDVKTKKCEARVYGIMKGPGDED